MKASEFVPGLLFRIDRQVGVMSEYVYEVSRVSSLNNDLWIREHGYFLKGKLTQSIDRADFRVKLRKNSFTIRLWAGGVELVSPIIKFSSLVPFTPTPEPPPDRVIQSGFTPNTPPTVTNTSTI